ncbi:MAG: hypothetical protein AB1792_10340 [Candidatus Zixiibacteriota bacterium]
MAKATLSERARRETNAHAGFRVDGGGVNPWAERKSAAVDDGGLRVNPAFTTAGMPPPDPVGSLAFASTSYDYQHNLSQGYQTARVAGADIVHFTWTGWTHIPLSIEDADRFVCYSSYRFGVGFNQPYNGVCGWGDVYTRGGYGNGDVDDQNCFHEFLHQRAEAGIPYTSWHLYYPTPGSALHIADELTSTPVFGEVLWPRGTVQWNADPTPDVYHVISHGANEDPADRIVYWRLDGQVWQGPVAIDSIFQLSYTLAADPNSEKCAITLTTDREFSSGNLNVCYYESHTEGAGWISGAELGAANKNIITNYNDPNGPQAWGHTSTRYDNSGYLHIIWDEQRVANTSHDIAIRHWSDSLGEIRPVAFGYWENLHSTGAFNLHLAKMTMGIGSGGTLCQGGLQSNKNYVYVVYTQFGGWDEASQNDASALDYYNGELYLTVSNSGGHTWSPAVNITNTKTPGCNPGATPPGGTLPPRPDSVCRSEHWATIGPHVNDIDVFLIEDNDAGGIPQGEGTWQINRAMYLRLPGGTTDAPYVCPALAANFAATLTSIPECEYHAPPGGFNDETLTITNIGTAAMTGTITVEELNGPTGWLILSESGEYTIASGDPEKSITVHMDATGITTEGLYQGRITITHNDPVHPSPQVFPIDFFVVDEFYCPQEVIGGFRTGVNGVDWCLDLDVRSNARFGAQEDEGGLFRHIDSSSSIFDASLLIAHGTQPVGDTVVFHRFYDRNDPGQFGFRAQGDLVYNTDAYSTGHGYATATAKMSTSDSLIGITAEWVAPQHPDSDEFFLARYTVYSQGYQGHVRLDSVVVGLIVDLDVVPAARYGTVQHWANNHGAGDAARNFVWQQGTDTTGHVPPNPQWTATRYRGGVMLVGSPGMLVGAQVRPGSEIQAGGGPSSEFMYRTLVGMSGINTPVLPDTDLYTIMTLGKGVTLDPIHTARYVVALLSDTLDEASLQATADKARYYADSILGWKTERCMCGARFADPSPDGVTDVSDVVGAIDVGFRGIAGTTDPGCSYQRTDVNCDGVTSVVDIIRFTNVAFRGGQAVDNFCCP